MEKHNEATRNRPEGNRPIDAPLLRISLAERSAQLMEEKAWQTNDRNALTLFKSGHLSVVLVAMHQGAEMQTPQPENLLTLQVLTGKLALTAARHTLEAIPGDLLALHEQIHYTVQAVEESTFLLTVVE